MAFPQDCDAVTKLTSRVSTRLLATSSLRSHRHPSRKSGAVLQLRHLIAVQSPDHDNLPPPQPQLKLGTVTDFGLECIATLQQLRCVDVSGCTHFSGAGLFMMASGLPRVENLSLDNCPQVTDDDLMVLASVPVIPHNFRCVKLTGCWGVTDAGLKHLANFHELRVLHLTCSGLTDDVLTMIAHALPSLRQVKLGGCWNLSNDGLASFVAPLKFLQRLKLVRCTQLSDVGMAAIAHVQAAHRSLLELELSGCADVTDDGILSLATFVRTLTHLQIVGCPGVTEQGLAHLCRLLPLLQHLKLGGARVSQTAASCTSADHFSSALLKFDQLCGHFRRWACFSGVPVSPALCRAWSLPLRHRSRSGLARDPPSPPAPHAGVLPPPHQLWASATHQSYASRSTHAAQL